MDGIQRREFHNNAQTYKHYLIFSTFLADTLFYILCARIQPMFFLVHSVQLLADSTYGNHTYAFRFAVYINSFKVVLTPQSYTRLSLLLGSAFYRVYGGMDW